MEYNLEHYEKSENSRKKDVIDFIYAHNKEFSEFDLSIEEQAKKWFEKEGEELSGKRAIERYYDKLCDELIVITQDKNVVACRFVEFDEDDEYFR